MTEKLRASLELPDHDSPQLSSDPPLSNEKRLEPQSPTAPSAQLSTAKTTILMIALCLCVFLAALDITIITTALPTISQHFNSVAGYTWVGAAYTLAEAASTPNWGKFSDIWGRKLILQIAIAVFFLGSVLSAASVNLPMLIIGRAIQGIGGGGLLTLVNIVIGDLFSLRDRGKYYGFVGMTWAIAASVGPVVGGALTEKVSWRWCFYINLPITGCVFVVIFLLLKLDSPRVPIWLGIKAIDWFGSITIVGSTVMLLIGLQFGGVTHPWNSAIVIGLIVSGIVTAVIFVLIERKVARYPLMPLRLFATVSNAATVVACFIHGAVFVTGTFYLPLYFQGVLGAPALLSGVWLLPLAGAMSLAAAFTGAICSMTGRYLELIWSGFAFMTLGFGLLIDLDATRAWPKIILYQILAGVGVGPNFQALLISIQSGVDPQDIATATAAFGFDRNLASSIGVVVGGVIFQNGIQKQARLLQQSLGAQADRLLGGAGIAAVGEINALPEAQREVVRHVFQQSIRDIWYFAVAIAGIGLLVVLGIRRKVLSRDHVKTKIGLDAEKERRQANLPSKKDISA